MFLFRAVPLVVIGLALAGPVRAQNDCNANGVDDAQDISNGTVDDCNGNGIPDVCENAFKISRTTPANGVSFSLHAADFTSDGKLDLAYVDRSANTVVVLVGDGAGGFTATPFAVGAAPDSLAVADFNGDQLPDLAVANSGDDTVTILLNAGHVGSAAFTGGGTLQTGLAPIFIVATDLDADGDQDLVVANAGQQTIRLLLNDGHAVFSAVVPDKDAKGEPFTMIAAPFDGDNRPDLAVANEESNNLSIILSGGAALPPTAGNFDGPAGLAAGDFDGDGLQDLAVANFKSSRVLILRNTGNGLFSPGQEITAVSGPFYLLAQDINGDGRIDLIVTGATGSGANSQSSATLLAGAGDGTFQVNAHGELPGAIIDSFVYGTFVSASGPQVAALDTQGKQILFLSLEGPECTTSPPPQPSCGACGAGGSAMVPLMLAGLLLMRAGGGRPRRFPRN